MAINWSSIGNSLKNGALEVTRDALWEKGQELVQEEREKGKSILAGALHDIDVKDDQIIRLLQKYYEVTEGEAEEIIRIEKTQNAPCKKIIDYLMREEGYSRNDAMDFISDHDVPGLLRETRGLWRKSPEEIIRLAEQKRPKIHL